MQTVPLSVYERAQGAPKAVDTAMTARQLQRMDFPPLKYIIPKLVTEGATLLAGKPKMGKSWLALDWCLAVAYGGYSMGSVKCEQGDVLYAALEDNPRRLQRRLRQVVPADQEWPDRLTLATRLSRIDSGLIEEIRRWHSSTEDPRLVVIDTHAQVRPPRKPSATPYEADYASVAPLQALAGELKIAIVIVHHVRKMESNDPLDMVSGTTGLTGGVDAVIVLYRDEQGAVISGRGRDLDDFEKAMKLTGGHWDIMGDAADERRSNERKVILNAMKEIGGVCSPKEIADQAGMKEDNVRQLVRKMAKAGDIESPEYGKYKLPG